METVVSFLRSSEAAVADGVFNGRYYAVLVNPATQDDHFYVTILSKIASQREMRNSRTDMQFTERPLPRDKIAGYVEQYVPSGCLKWTAYKESHRWTHHETAYG